MGGVVSTGRDNDDLVDNLKEAEYIKSETVEQVFRIVDRAHYYLPECRESAYKDLAWKSGTLHLSAPCIYSEVMEALELRKGLSFLNLGSGTGYLNTMVGFMIGPNGVNHGVELHASNVAYAEERLTKFKEVSSYFDDLELCDPAFVEGNCLNLAPDNRRYDRVYCGAACPSEILSTVQNMIKIQGILVVPVGDQLLKIRRISETDFSSDNVLPVSFASLVEPSAPKGVQDLIILPEINPMSLQDICRNTIRETIRSTFTFEKHQPKASSDSSNGGKSLPTPCVYRQERGRYPLNILPTARGFMIMGSFSDDSDASDGSEQIDGGFLDQQLQRHAMERRQHNLDTAEVDSNLSDHELQDETDNADKGCKREMRVDNYLKSAREKLESMESEDGIVADDEGDEDDLELKELSSGKANREESTAVHEEMAQPWLKEGASKSSKSGLNKNGNAKRMKVTSMERNSWKGSSELNKSSENRHSLSSDEEVLVPDSKVISSPAIEMNMFNSNTRTSKTSYSTSADTSETSGFGSLGDDHIQIGSMHSGLHNPNDDINENNENKSDKSSNDVHMLSNSPVNKSKLKKSIWLNLSQQSNSSDDAETANDEDDEGNENDDSALKEAWMDIDDRDDHIKIKKSRGHGHVRGESDDSDDPDGEDKEEKQEEIKPPPLPANGFTVFLKKQLETLPIPSTMKGFICHFR